MGKVKVLVSKGDSTSSGSQFHSPKLVPTRRSVGNKRKVVFVFRTQQFLFGMKYPHLSVILEFFFEHHNRMDHCHMLENFVKGILHKLCYIQHEVLVLPITLDLELV